MSAEKKLISIFSKSPWYKKLEILRVSNGWNQEETAEKCGTSKRIYWNWENGVCMPIKNNRKYISKIFGVPEEDIFSKIEKEQEL
ncbi:MAG: helix-turn-helix transcriptional regulator [Deltaproteobacteria bacterium]